MNIEIETKRLMIRNFLESDGADLYDYLSKNEVVKFEPYETYSYEQAMWEAARRAQDERFYAVVLKEGKMIGNLYLSRGDFDSWELGYVFHNDFWGKGYALESAKALISYIFEIGQARRIIAMCNPLNMRSWRLLERLGFRREGTLINNIYFFRDEKGDPIWQDTYEYGLLAQEWNFYERRKER